MILAEKFGEIADISLIRHVFWLILNKTRTILICRLTENKIMLIMGIVSNDNHFH